LAIIYLNLNLFKYTFWIFIWIFSFTKHSCLRYDTFACNSWYVFCI